MPTQRRDAGIAAVAGLLLALAGCATAPRPAPPAPTPPVWDESDDWRRLVTMPFGSSLQDLPGRAEAHEVLTFHGEAAAAREDRECYALPDVPTRFIGRDANAYLYCYWHGRLDRLEADTTLAAEEGTEAFQRFCDHWQAGAAAATRSADRCRGQDGALAFEADLGDANEDGTVPVSIVVYDAAAEAEREQEKR